MNEFESDGNSLSQSFVQNSWIQDGRIVDGCHHQVNQIELVWVRFRVEEKCFWVNLREDNKVFESKMSVSESKMPEFKMAAIIKFSQNEWVKFFFMQNGWILDGRAQDGCHHQVESEWLSEVIFCAKWLNLRSQNSRWLPPSSWVRINEFESDINSLSQSFVQNGWIQDGRIQDGCHYQVESEWMSEVFCVNVGN